MSFLRRSALLGLAALVATAGLARAAGSGEIFPFQVTESTLDNGLQVLIIPYDSPGTVAHYLVVRTGSRDEVEPGHSGFAHFFEHMMFRGTEKYPVERYKATLKAMGADANASTGSDVTRYYIVGPSAELAKIMELESDRFQNLKYSEEVFRTEAQAVLGEYNKNFANPIMPLMQEMRSLSYTQHTYRHLPIGFLEDIKAMPTYYAYSLGFFDRFYRPENTTLVVVGDVKPAEGLALAKQYYGGWKRGYKKADVKAEPPQTKRMTGHVDWPNPTRPYFLLAHHMPAFSTSDPASAAVDVIGQFLFSESAPLYQELVIEKQWVDVLSGSPFTSRDPGQFTIFGRAKSEDLIPKVQEVIDRHFAELAAKPIPAERFARIKSYLRYQFALGLDAPGNVADQVSEMISLTGDWKSINERFAQYEKLTAEDVQKAARSIFRKENETFVTLSHKPAQKGTEADKSGGAK